MNNILNFLKKPSLAVIIPAYNEERVIAATLQALKLQVPAENIFVVDDGSRDKTREIAIENLMASQVLTISNGGKANAINNVISYYELTKKYDLIMVHDADTRMELGFVDEIIRIYQQDSSDQVACVMGRVRGQDYTWVSAYRVWEYELGQTVHKSAQSYIGGVTVCPGCSSVYRSRVFDILRMPHGTMTEDMDLTFDMHRKGLGKLVFASDAVMVTQDPRTVQDYIKQVRRWYTGFWQCVLKHQVPWGGGMLDLEVTMMALESLFQSLLFIVTIALSPWIIMNRPEMLVYVLLLDVVLFTGPTLLWTMWKTNNFHLIVYFFHFYVLRILSSFLFFQSFFRVCFGWDIALGLVWDTKRYSVSSRKFFQWFWKPEPQALEAQIQST